MYKNKYFYFYI